MPTHDYKLRDGTRVPGVTTRLGRTLGWSKEALVGWAAKIAGRGQDWRLVRDLEGDVGTAVHAVVQKVLEGTLLTQAQLVEFAHTFFMSLPEHHRVRAMRACYAWFDWWHHHEFKVVHIEIPLVSEKYRCGGTPDLICEIPHEGSRLLAVADWKSGKRVHQEVAIQLAGYALLYEDVHGRRVDELFGVHLNKETMVWETHWVPYDVREKAEDIFKCVCFIDGAYGDVKMDVIAKGKPEVVW